LKPGLIIAISLFTVSLSCQTSKPSLEYCASIEDPAERFACYEAMAGRWHADTTKAGGTAPAVVEPGAAGAEAVVPASPAAAPNVPAVETKQNAEATFGMEDKQKKARPDKLKVKWTWKKKDARGKWIIALENGQVWRQTDTRPFIFENPEHWVIVSRGFAGGFFLGEPESHVRIRVKLAE
jgi:hypothetical protein